MKGFEQIENTFEIAVFSQNQAYRELFQRLEPITLVIQLGNIEPNLDCKAVFIDGETISFRQLNDCRMLYPDVPMFFKLDQVTSFSQMKNLQTVCHALNIIPIRENTTPEQAVQEVNMHLFKQQNQAVNRIVGFFGTHSGAGVSTTVLNVAKALAGKVEERILVLALNPWDPADYFFNYTGKYLNDIKVDLKTGSITEEKLMDAVVEYKGFYHLAGNRDIKLQRFYHVEEIERLIKLAQSCFDLILIDAGPHFDNAGYAQAFVQSELKFLVTDQSEKGYRGYWPYIFNQLIEPIGGTTNDFILLVNQFRPDPSLISEKDIQVELDMHLLTTIPHMDTLGNISIRQKQMLYDLADEPYRMAIQTIANSIMARANLTEKKKHEYEEKKKGGFFKRLFKKKSDMSVEEEFYDEAL